MRILVPLDGSPLAEAALPTAQRLAVIPGGEIHLLTVLQPTEVDSFSAVTSDLGGPLTDDVGAIPGQGDAAHDEQVSFLAGHYLEQVARAFPDTTVRSSVVFGPSVANEIDLYARSNAIDLIVMATHARTGLDGLLHGSVAGDVLCSGVAPVALVRPGGA